MGPAEIGVDADVVLAEIGGEVADGGFERRLGDAHDVVVRHHARGAAIGQRDHAPPFFIKEAARRATSVKE